MGHEVVVTVKDKVALMRHMLSYGHLMEQTEIRV